MAEDQDKQEEKFDFTAQGEALGYISLDQARVLAMRTARETPGDYGRRFRNSPMAFEVVEDEDTEDHYVITLSFRPMDSSPARRGKSSSSSRRKAPSPTGRCSACRWLRGRDASPLFQRSSGWRSLGRSRWQGWYLPLMGWAGKEVMKSKPPWLVPPARLCQLLPHRQR